MVLFKSGVLFQYPGFVIASLVGAGAANFLKHPAPWLEGIVAGVHACILHKPRCDMIKQRLKMPCMLQSVPCLSLLGLATEHADLMKWLLGVQCWTSRSFSFHILP